jgi:hypothetical protein
MSGRSANKKWTDLFCRVPNSDDGTPRFSVSGAKGYLYEYDGYSGGHVTLDRIIEILEKHGISPDISGEDSSLNVSSFEYWFYIADSSEDGNEDGCLRIYCGNYFFGPPGHGAFVEGFAAFRWLLGQLGIKQPRRFKSEVLPG